MSDETTARACAECGRPVAWQRPAVGQVFAGLLSRIAPVCTACSDAAEREAAKRDCAEEQARQAERTGRRFALSGLPAKYRGLALDGLEHRPEHIAACRQWAQDGGGLLLVGPFGVGKTTLAGAATAVALSRRLVFWTSAPLLFARLGTGLDSQQRQWALDVLAGRYALVLDDIDKARPTDYGAEQVFLAVDQRVEHELPLLVTSNLALGALAERCPEPYGDAIASRLAGYCRVLRVNGNDRRLRAPDQEVGQ